MKRSVFLFGALLCLALLAVADDKKSAQERYIERYADIAVREMYRSGVPASITLAQGLLESAAGQSRLATKGNNHFGIKCHNDWKGKTMRADDDRPKECFRVYGSPEQSFRDHSDFLRYRDRYKFLFELKITDYKGWAHGLKKAGYATDPGYAGKLIDYIERYDLAQYDRRKLSKKEQQRFEEAESGGDDAQAADDAQQAEAPGEEEALAELPASPLELEAARPLSELQHEEIRFSLTRPVYTRNGVPFVYAVKGDSYRSLARENDLFLREILKFNEAGRKDPLHPGDIVYLQPKKKSAPKGLDKYIVDADGESLRVISQRFGVRLSSILEMNGMDAHYPLQEGDVVLLRKP